LEAAFSGFHRSSRGCRGKKPVGLLIVLALTTQMGWKEVVAIAGVMAVALVNWVWAHRALRPAGDNNCRKFKTVPVFGRTKAEHKFANRMID
jgi:hypothetical protein